MFSGLDLSGANTLHAAIFFVQVLRMDYYVMDQLVTQAPCNLYSIVGEFHAIYVL
jgi:hypothetical protein